jgi:D-tagatose-1,6-bisphosphate aldolase subunit GatZ/KbaZ
MKNDSHPLRKIVSLNRQKNPIGVFSVCSSDPMVIRAAVRDAVVNDYPVVIESTANQVNQFGGYTGMKPLDFVELVQRIVQEEGLPTSQLILGGDHLGPLTWTNYPEMEAMELSKALVRSYILSGYTKIHIDTSMKLADDGPGPLDVHVSARRGAELVSVALQAFEEYVSSNPEAPSPVFIVGSEVPIPGGSQVHENSLQPTDPKDFTYQFGVFKSTFEEFDIDFNQVIAFVVQPGVEFGDDFVIQYDRKKAANLIDSLQTTSGVVFEGHSTDYQTTESLSHLIEDGVGILKVGPALTFRLREALQKLEHIECLLIDQESQRSQFMQTLLATMDNNPKYWARYYQGNPQEVKFKKVFSYSDRCRYYLSEKDVQKSIKSLFENVKTVPEAMMSLYFPNQYTSCMNGKISQDSNEIVLDYIQEECRRYAKAGNLM